MCLALGHKANQRQSQDLKTGSLTPESGLICFLSRDPVFFPKSKENNNKA